MQIRYQAGRSGRCHESRAGPALSLPSIWPLRLPDAAELGTNDEAYTGVVITTAAELGLVADNAPQQPQVGWRPFAVSSPPAMGANGCADLELAGGQFRERLTDPVALVLSRLQSPGLHERVGVFVPTAIREIVAQHGGRCLCLLDDAQRHVGLRKPQQGLLDVACALIPRHHLFEAVDRAGVVAAIQQLTPDIHLLAGQLVAGDLDLALGGDRVFGIGIFANDLFESLHRLLGALLVTRDFWHLIEIGRADEELRIGGVRASRMQRDVSARRADA